MNYGSIFGNGLYAPNKIAEKTNSQSRNMCSGGTKLVKGQVGMMLCHFGRVLSQPVDKLDLLWRSADSRSCS